MALTIHSLWKMRRTLAMLSLTALTAAAQSPSFDVAAIHADKSDSQSTHWEDNRGRMTVTNVSLQKLIAFAYQVHDFQISGPDWLRSQRFDIQAEGAEWANKAERPLILQNLLSERFKLVLHREAKELPMFALVTTKDGPKLQSVDAHGTSGISSGRGHMTLERASMKELVDSLSQRVDRPVIDKTGLTGAFNGELHWTPDDQPASPAAIVPGGAALENAAPSLFTALQEQLGLKLMPQRGPVELLVIDHAERVPTEN